MDENVAAATIGQRMREREIIRKAQRMQDLIAIIAALPAIIAADERHIFREKYCYNLTRFNFSENEAAALRRIFCVPEVENIESEFERYLRETFSKPGTFVAYPDGKAFYRNYETIPFQAFLRTESLQAEIVRNPADDCYDIVATPADPD